MVNCEFMLYRLLQRTLQPFLKKNREEFLALKVLVLAPVGVLGVSPQGKFANLVSFKWYFLQFDISFVVF